MMYVILHLSKKDLCQNSAQNEMLTHYNRIVIGCFKDLFQSMDTNNLAEVLQALKELNFTLANRALALAAHYNMALEPHQSSAEEVPELVKAYLHCGTAYNPKHSIRGRPTLDVINTIGTTDSHLHYQGTTSRHKGEMHIFILILIDITIILIFITVVRIILLIPLEMSIIPVVIK